MKSLKKLSYLVLLSFLFFTSCRDDDDTTFLVEEEETQLRGDYDQGILVSNEGPFGTGTGTVSFISENFETVNQAIYNQVNNDDLGNIVQSIGFNDDTAYIVANNSHQIKVVNRYTFEEIATITEGLNNPRYFIAIGDTGYVSNWGDPFDNNDDYIAVVDLNTNTVSSSIPVDFGPEKLGVSGTTLFVAHQGGYGQNNLVSVINSTNNEVSTTITVGDVPNSMQFVGTNLWVLCGGNSSYTGNETIGSLVKIDITTNEVSQTLQFNLTEHPSHLSLNNNTLYYSLNGAVYPFEVTDTELSSNSIIEGFFYFMTTKDGKLYATDAGDFQSNGFLKVYDLTTFVEEQNIEVGIIPGGVYFNE